MTWLAPLSVALLADVDDGHHMWGGDGWMWLWGSLMMVFWVAVLALIVWAVVRGFGGRTRHEDGARQILAERYARGELSTEEYSERLDALYHTRR